MMGVAPIAQLPRIGSQMLEGRGSNPRLGGLGASQHKHNIIGRSAPDKKKHLYLSIEYWSIEYWSFGSCKSKSDPSLWRDRHPAIKGLRTSGAPRRASPSGPNKHKKCKSVRTKQIIQKGVIPVSVKKHPFARAVALQSISRSCSPPPDLVLLKLGFPRVFSAGGVFFYRAPRGAIPSGPKRLLRVNKHTM